MPHELGIGRPSRHVLNRIAPVRGPDLQCVAVVEDRTPSVGIGLIGVAYRLRNTTPFSRVVLVPHPHFVAPARGDVYPVLQASRGRVLRSRARADE